MRELKTLLLILAIATATMEVNTVQAAPVSASVQLGTVADSFSLIEKTQYVSGGKQYCWYDNGWKGPGWYWCGYNLRQGFGYGGPPGWQNWHPGSPPLHGPGSSHNPTSPMPPPAGPGAPIVPNLPKNYQSPGLGCAVCAPPPSNKQGPSSGSTNPTKQGPPPPPGGRPPNTGGGGGGGGGHH
jgi:hypothetical protein